MAAWHISFLVVGRAMPQPLPCPVIGVFLCPPLALCILSLIPSTSVFTGVAGARGASPLTVGQDPHLVWGWGSAGGGHTWVLMWEIWG